jgi:cyclic pyranopterin phosphate synthase
MLSHIDDENRPRMVDIGGKTRTKRIARARARIELPPEIVVEWRDGELRTKKGPVVETAILAGVMAAKRTPDLIPLCHGVAMEDCQVAITYRSPNELEIECTASAHDKTGVEMEALVGAALAALTVYDMCKALSHEIVIKEIRLVEKRGGRRDVRL